MHLEFSIPEEHVGSPLAMPGVTQNPYRDLDAVSGCNDPEGYIARVGEATRRIHERALAVTAVTSGDANDHSKNPAFKRFLDEQVFKRHGGNPFFVMGEKGNDLSLGTRDTFRQHGILQSIGSASDKVDEGLESQRLRLGPLYARQLEASREVVNAPAGALIIDVGAGKDYERIRGLDTYARERRGRLLCHDVVPTLARVSAAQIDGIPYLAVPPRFKFLDEVLRALPQDRAKIMTLQNVASSIAFGSLTDLLYIAQLSHVDKVMVEQSLGLASNSNMIPVGWHTGADVFEKKASFELVKANLDKAVSPHLLPFVVSMMTMQAQLTMEALVTEIARMYMIDAAKQMGLAHHRTLILEQQEDLEPEQAVDHLTQHSIPTVATYFQQGDFNTMELGPFGIRLTKNLAVQPRRLRLRSLRSIIELSRHPLGDQPRLSPRKGQNVRSITQADRSMTPKAFRREDPLYILSAYNFLCKGHYPPVSVGAFRSIPPSVLDYIAHLGATIGGNTVLHEWGEHHPYIRQYLGHGNRFQEEFLNRI